MGMIVLADLVSPKERGRYYTYFALTYTSAGGAGPALGGFIADHLYWSVIFWINIPMGLAALAITSSLLNRLPRHERPHRLDLVGLALIVVASASRVVPVLLTVIVGRVTDIGATHLGAWFAGHVTPMDAAVALTSTAIVTVGLTLVGGLVVPLAALAALLGGAVAGGTIVSLRGSLDGDGLGAAVELSVVTGLVAAAVVS